MKLVKLTEPSRNFSVMNSVVIPRDPRDGREKVAMTNYAAENIGCLLLVDPETFEGESHPFPNDAGAWGLIWLEERKELIIGTCDHLGSLHCFDMAERKFREPLNLPGETYLWDFALGGDGCVYGGTYPGCSLVRYDPAARTLEGLGKVGDYEENLYTRPTLTNADGNILICSGFAQTQTWLYGIAEKSYTQIGQLGDRLQAAGKEYIITESDNGHKVFDPYSLAQLGETIDLTQDEWKNSDNIPQSAKDFLMTLVSPPKYRGKSLACGDLFGVRGQEVFRIHEDDEPDFHRIPGQAPSTAVMTIAAMGGVIWGSSENGQTIFCYDPRSGELSNTNCVANAGGEVYGMVPLDGKLYMTAYIGGDHIVYDPTAPWDQRNNINPKSLRSVAPQMVRPHAKSVLADDGGIWTGWYANYGSYGGGISRIDPQTQEVTSWFDVMPGQAIEHIAAGEGCLYVITSGEASGMSARDDQFCLLKLDYQANILNTYQFCKGITLRRLAVHTDSIIVTTMNQSHDQSALAIINRDSFTLAQTIPTGDYNHQASELLIHENKLFVFNNFEVLLYALPQMHLTDRCNAPVWCGSSTVDAQGRVYCALRRELYRLELE